MQEYIRALSEHIQKNPVIFDTVTETPCLEALWWHYSGFYPIHNEHSKKILAEIRGKLSGNDNVDEMIDLISCLCAEHEQLAFAAGMKLGVQLMTEIQDK